MNTYEVRWVDIDGKRYSETWQSDDDRNTAIEKKMAEMAERAKSRGWDVEGRP